MHPDQCYNEINEGEESKRVFESKNKEPNKSIRHKEAATKGKVRRQIKPPPSSRGGTKDTYLRFASGQHEIPMTSLGSHAYDDKLRAQASTGQNLQNPKKDTSLEVDQTPSLGEKKIPSQSKPTGTKSATLDAPHPTRCATTPWDNYPRSTIKHQDLLQGKSSKLSRWNSTPAMAIKSRLAGVEAAMTESGSRYDSRVKASYDGSYHDGILLLLWRLNQNPLRWKRYDEILLLLRWSNQDLQWKPLWRSNQDPLRETINRCPLLEATEGEPATRSCKAEGGGRDEWRRNNLPKWKG